MIHEHVMPVPAKAIPSLSLIDLLSQDKETLLNSDNFPVIVQNLKFFMQELKRSLQAFFIDKEYAKFDPHVGDTACHIRAYHILHLSRVRESDSLSNKASVLKRLEEVGSVELQFNDWVKDMEPRDYKKQKIKSFFQAWFLKLQCSEIEAFILQSYFLTRFMHMADDLSYSYIDANKVSEEAQLGKNATRLLIIKFQKNISEYSIDFLLELLQKTSWPQLKFSKEDLNVIVNYDEYNRKVMPAFVAMDIILENLLKNSMGIIFSVQRRVKKANVDLINIFWDVNGTASEFIIQDPEQINASNPYYVVYGFADYDFGDAIESPEAYIKKVQSYGPKKIMLANLAAHPQFSGTKFLQFSDQCYISLNPSQALSDLNERKLQFSTLAEVDGLCLKNAKIFHAQHAFCDTPSHLMSNQDKLIKSFEKNMELFYGDSKFFEVQEAE